ncbi:MAG: hypothetical protein AAF849_05885 [Bacteroidota bacterium]
MRGFPRLRRENPFGGRDESAVKPPIYLSLLTFPSLRQQRRIWNFDTYETLLQHLLITAFRHNQKSSNKYGCVSRSFCSRATGAAVEGFGLGELFF